MAPISALLLPALAATSSALLWARQDAPVDPATHNSSTSTACAPVHIMVVRGSTEDPGQGIIGTLATLITAANPGSTVEWIQYPALLTSYDTSSHNGTIATTDRLKNYVDTCDSEGGNSSIVLLGYSQGAHVIGDTMCGGGLSPVLGPYTPPIDDKYASQVAAMILMGDPRHVANLSYDVGTATENGLFPRPKNISCDKYGSIIQSYCDAGDVYCAAGDQKGVHGNYTHKYNQDAFKFVESKLQAKSMANSSNSSSSGSSSSSNGSSSGGSGSGSSGSTGKSSGNVSSRPANYGTLVLVSILGAVFALGI